jgi:hypothetical protein
VYKLVFFEKRNFCFFLVRVPPYGEKKRKIFFYQYMAIHTPIESPGRVDKNYAVFKIIYGVIRPIKAKNRVKMLKNRLFEVEKKS